LSGIRRRTVLLVDDNEEFLATTRERLESANNQVFTAATIATAREILVTQKIDLVMSDLKLPDGDGFQFLNELRAKFPELSLLLISAYANDEIVERIENSGFTHFIAKPVDFKELEYAMASGEVITT